MKKKKKAKQKPGMPEFSFKEFTPEEGRIYEEAIARYRESVADGNKLKQAYESYSISDQELRALIQADFLKILIAERHFSQNQPLEKIARDLDISPEIVMDAHARMLQEAGVTAANQFGEEFGSIMPKTND